MSSRLAWLAITDPTDRAMQQAADFAVRAEAAGLDGVGFADHQHSGRDTYIRLAMAAVETTRIHLFPCVTNPLTRHPMVLASLANSLSELSGGRFRMVVGAGDQSARHMGRGAASLSEMREAVGTMRTLLSGGATAIGNSPAEQLGHVTELRTAVYINASSPKMIQLAGELADGVLLMVGRDPAVVADALAELRVGAERSGRTTDDLYVAFALPTFIDESATAARQRAESVLRFWLARPTRLFTRHAKRTQASEDDLLSTMGLVGTPADCAEQLLALAERGCDHVVCQLYGDAGDGGAVLKAFEDTIVPRTR